MAPTAADVHDSTPVLVGVGRYTFHRKGRAGDQGRYGASPLEMLLEAARRAATDAGQEPQGLEVNSLVHVSAATDALAIAAASEEKAASLGGDRLLYPNTPATVAAALGCPTDAVQELVMTGDSGSMPQVLVNRAFEQVARGEIRSALIVGAEALHSFNAMQASGVPAAEIRRRWGDAELRDEGARRRLSELQRAPGLSIYPAGKSLAEANRFYTEHWRKHGLGAPSASYPLIENALRLEAGRTLQEQQVKVGEIFSRFSKVAAQEREHAWFGTEYSPEELHTQTEENRPISHPFYLKRLNSVMAVDMSAALLIMSAGEARRRRVPHEKWIFLHGCSQANDRLELLERSSLCASPAIRVAGARALAMAGAQSAQDIQHMDIYSCFPSAVQVACKELNIDPGRQLTVTGGLPYHGGPGSNYVTHAIGAMAEKLREGRPAQARGLVTANGGYLTKHSFGVYANFPDEAAARGTWRREDPAVCQAEVDAEPWEKVAESPEGTGVVESYCVRYGRKGPELGVVVGRLLDGPQAGRRFVANAPPGGAAALAPYIEGDPVGQRGTVTTVAGKGVFRLQEPASRL